MRRPRRRDGAGPGRREQWRGVERTLAWLADSPAPIRFNPAFVAWVAAECADLERLAGPGGLEPDRCLARGLEQRIFRLAERLFAEAHFALACEVRHV